MLGDKSHWSWRPGLYQVLAFAAFFGGATLYNGTRDELFILLGFAGFFVLASYAMHLTGERTSKIVAGFGVFLSGMAVIHEFLAAPHWPARPDSASGAVVPIHISWEPFDGAIRYATQWEHLWLQSIVWVGLPCFAYAVIVTAWDWWKE